MARPSPVTRRSIALLPATLLLALLAPAAVLACSGFSAGTLAEVYRAADVIAVVRVETRIDVEGGWDYVLTVEQVVKGDPPRNWALPKAPASDCGTLRLEPGERYLIEYWRPGRIIDTPEPRPWFYAWGTHDGVFLPSAPHEPQPTTMEDLLAAYDRIAAAPNTATGEAEPAERLGDRPWLLLLGGFVVGLVVAVRQLRARA